MVENGKRRCRRFKIPNAEIQYRRRGLRGLGRWSTPRLLANLGRRGLAFLCEETLPEDLKLTIRLMVPDEDPMYVDGEVRWQAHCWGGMQTVGLAFLPFGSWRGRNTRSALARLTALEAEYGADTDARVPALACAAAG